MTILLDTHVLVWLVSEPDKLSSAAAQAISADDEPAVAAISWFEIAWLAQRGRIASTRPIRSWLEEIAQRVRTVGITPAIAATAVALPDSFPRDPADRLIYATAVEYGWPLVTKDERMRSHAHLRQITVW
jgi:PIN domain nuclease of toxin-antitoxin system